MSSGIAKKLLCGAMSVLMVASMAACSPKNGDGGSTNGGVGNAASGAVSTGLNKDKISDFYSYVNHDWIVEHELQPWEYEESAIEEGTYDTLDAFHDIFAGTELDSLAEDDPMYKLKQYYNQLSDLDMINDVSMKKIRKMADHIMSAKNISDISALMEDEDYSLFNPVGEVRNLINTSGDYIPTFLPVPLMGIGQELTDEERACIVSGYAKQIECLGYSSEESLTIAENAVKFDDMVHEFYGTSDYNYYGYGEKEWKETGCPIDFISIQEKLNYYRIDWLEKKYTGFFMLGGYPEWLSETMVAENIDYIKASYLVHMIDKLNGIGSYEFAVANDAMKNMAGATADYPDIEDDEATEFFPLYAILGIDEGALASYYMDTYVSEEQVQRVRDLTQEIVDAYVELFEETDWLDLRQRDRLIIKVKKAQLYIGKYDEYNHYEDVEIGEDVVDTTLSLMKSNRRFSQRMLVEDGKYMPTESSVYQSNAFYFPEQNSMLIGIGYFLGHVRVEDSSFEVILANIGSSIAHELGHAFDGASVGNRNDGQYDASWNDFWEYYQQSYNKLYYYYDGMKTPYGYSLNGSRVLNEGFADLMGLQMQMRVLAKHEDADYDEFFTAYAKLRACVYRPEYEGYCVRHDGHTVGLVRVNSLLFQLDEFYDTYEVDTKSPFYVKPADRIKIFVYEE